MASKKTIESYRKLASSAKYREAINRSAEFKEKLSEANAFRLDSIASEANSYFTRLNSASPEIFDVIKIQRKELSELLIRKRTGLGVVLD